MRYYLKHAIIGGSYFYGWGLIKRIFRDFDSPRPMGTLKGPSRNRLGI